MLRYLSGVNILKHDYSITVLGLLELKILSQRILFTLAVAFAVVSAQAQQARYQLISPANADTVSIYSDSPDSTQEWIVVFSSTIAQKKAQSGLFEQDLRAAIANFYGPSKLAQTWVTPLPLIHGAAFSAPNRIIPTLLKQSYVEYIDRNHEVRINPTTQTAVHDDRGTNRFTELGAFTGKGVVIAIIDTGVDYTHPDLGGCLGVQCRVMGGYDIVDDDTDPFDENGHGTHVAGIAVGSGLSSGVAQDAKILAYRALNAAGSGTMAGTIEAIQMAVSDGAHIINMSLGASGAPPDNPLNLAVREAVKKGVLVVASAGNSGPYWGTISSPGSEGLALTVAALDADGQVARFSSRGPVRTSFELKPDISAPGVAILSAAPGGGHIRLSGTSMAAPYVAGLAARVWEMMPQADVLSIRGRIIQSATTTAQSFWSSGLGEAQTILSQYSNVATHPTAISIKVDEVPTNGSSEYQDHVLSVWNFSNSEHSATLTAQIPVGVNIQIQQSASIPASAKIDIPIRLHVDPTMIPFPTEVPPVYLGAIQLAAGADTLEIPIVIARPSELEFEFASPPSLVVVHDKNGGFDFRGNPSRIFSMQLGAGLYDVWAIRDADATKWVIENVYVEGSTKRRVMDTDAKNTLRYELTDPDGTVVGACGYSREFLRHKPSNLALSYQYERSCPEVPSQNIQHQISSFGADMLYEVSHVAYGSPTGYEYLRYPVRFEGGINGNKLIRTGGDDFRAVNWRYVLPPSVKSVSYIRLYETAGGNSYTPPSWLKSVFVKPWVRKEHLIPNPEGIFAPFGTQYDKIFALEANQFDPDQDAVVLITPSVYLTPTDSMVFRLPETPNSATWTMPYPTKELVLGVGPDSWSAGSMVFTADEIKIPTSNTWFLGWNRELRTGSMELEIVDSNTETTWSKRVYNDIPAFGSIQSEDWITLRQTGVAYSLNLTRSDTYVGNRQQVTTVHLPLNASTVGLAQNCIDRLAIVDELGDPIQIAEFSSGLSILIESQECDLIPELVLVEWSSQESLTLDGSVTHTGSKRLIRYDLPEEMEAGYVDLTIYLRNRGEQLLEHRVSPALLITHGQHIPDLPVSPTLMSPSSRQFVFDNLVELVWTPIDDAVQYRVQLSLSGDFATIVQDSLVDVATIRFPVYGYGQVWYWRVMAKNDQGWGPWSLRRSFTTVIEATSMHEEQVPHDWDLLQNFPNPFNPTTTIDFRIGASEQVRIDIFSMTGQRIKTLDLGVLTSGKHSIMVDLSRMASGLYVYQLRTPSVRLSRKMTLVK